ncbi:hypothetical protein NC652_009568 [Populus alba x Populus x berolinensis]|nr:hypothetical protein NC652_009568 [Populus alba x Populus x berolinensis]
MRAFLEYLTVLPRILFFSDKIYPLESIPRPLRLGGDFHEGTRTKNFQEGRGRLTVLYSSTRLNTVLKETGRCFYLPPFLSPFSFGKREPCREL